MKKAFIILFALAFANTIFAYDFKAGDLYYNIIGSSEVEVTYEHLFSEENYSGATEVTIPETVTHEGTTYTVTAVGDLAFSECHSLETINIPNGIKRIGDSAFNLCTSLTSVIIPGSMKKIEEGAFWGCNTLASITMPDNVIIEGNAFHDTEWYFNQPEGFIYLGNALYGYKGNMPENTSLTIKDGTTTISDNALYDCYNLTDINFPSSIEYVGTFALSGTQWYENLQDGLIYINDVLYQCKGNPDSHVEIKNGTVCISGFAFSNCEDIKSVTIPSTVTTIGENAFGYCYSLESINIPNSVKSIGEHAFYCCTGLTSATIGNGISDMDGALFSGCENLNSVSFTQGATVLGNNIFDECSALTSVVLPNTITFIGENAFNDCRSLNTINIPTGVKILRNGVCSGCTSLTEINIPNSVTSIGASAFQGCSSVTSVIIGNGVTSIGEGAFYDCNSLSSITIPEGVKKIEGDIFNGCPLSTVVWNAKNCINFGYDHDNGHYIESPFESRNDYITSFTFGKNVEYIPSNLCNGLNGITSITIPSSVTSIGADAFHGCSGLTEITIPENIENIGEGAFYNCQSLASITWNAKECSLYNEDEDIYYYIFDWENISSFTIGKNVQKLPKLTETGNAIITVEDGNAKYDSRNGCNAIIETATNTLISGNGNTTIPNSIEHISKDAFSHCNDIKAITIPNGVKTIGDNAFKNCRSLVSVEIPATVTQIGEYAFENCLALTAISISKSVTSIGEGLLECCPSLNSIVIEEGNPNYDSRENCNAIIETATNVLKQGCKSTIIPSGVKSIGMMAFTDCVELFAISIPNDVEIIEDYAFIECSDLKTINIGTGVKSIGKGAFGECCALTSITIPNSVETIGDYAFAYCVSIKNINIGANVKSIGEEVFEDCEAVEKICCYAVVPPTVGEDCFKDLYTATLQVPSEALANYQNHEVWGLFENIEIIASEKTETDGIEVSPSTDEVTIVWPIDVNAETYTLTIKKEEEVICTFTFNADGLLLNIAFSQGINRDIKQETESGNGLRFTVTGLDNGEHYSYTITAKDSSEQTIQTYSGEFTTEILTCIENVSVPGIRFENGKVICDEKFTIYDMSGRDVTLQNGNLCGIYIIHTTSGCIKVEL